jgi:Tol biopolymer transport system component
VKTPYPIRSGPSVRGARRGALMSGAAAVALVVAAAPVLAEETLTLRVSESTEFLAADRDSDWPSLSGDGFQVAFASDASTLVTDDTNASRDVFVFDLSSGETTRVSLAEGGVEGDDGSDKPSISADGRFVAYQSAAGNLVAGDTNGQQDVFVHDRVTGETARVSVASDGSEAIGSSAWPAISADGNLVAFTSFAANLVPEDRNGHGDIFVHDRATGETSRVSIGAGGIEGDGVSEEPWISADGRFVAFASMATNLVPTDTNDERDAFVHDRTTGATVRISVASDGTQGDGTSYRPVLSADGGIAAFTSNAATLVPGDENLESDVFVHDLATRQTTRVNLNRAGNELRRDSSSVAISGDGRFVVFVTGDPYVVADDTNESTDVFLFDREEGLTTRLSVDSDGTEADGNSYGTAISGDGNLVAFASNAGNLVPGDENDVRDIFVRGPLR